MVITHQMVEYFVDFGEFTLFCLDGNVPAIERIADQLREELDDDMLFSKGEDNIYAIQQKGSKNAFVFLFPYILTKSDEDLVREIYGWLKNGEYSHQLLYIVFNASP